METYFQGFLMGLAYVAPIGVQNLFVINSAITQKRSKALLTALIVIFFDITLAFACFFGIGLLIDKLEWLKLIILLIGSLIIIYIGQGLLRSKSSLKESNETNISLTKIITTACVVTWFNPQAIIDGTMMLGAFRVSLPSDASTYFILGVTSASFTWFMGITIFISLFSHKFNDKILRIINIICGIIIIFYGIKLLLSFYNMISL
jgi:L-lysine permease